MYLIVLSRLQLGMSSFVLIIHTSCCRGEECYVGPIGQHSGSHMALAITLVVKIVPPRGRHGTSGGWLAARTCVPECSTFRPTVQIYNKAYIPRQSIDRLCTLYRDGRHSV